MFIFVLLFVFPVFLVFKILEAKISWSVRLFKTEFDTKIFFIAFLYMLALDHNLGLWALNQIIGFRDIPAYLFGIFVLTSVFLMFTMLLALNFQTALKVLSAGLLAIIAFNLLLGEKDIRKLTGSNFIFDKTPKDGASRSNTNSAGPTVVIILDEMIGIEGIDLKLPNGPETYNSSRALFEDFGFKAYGSAYSLYTQTLPSISATLNLISDIGDPRKFSDESPTYGYKYVLRSNKFFDQIQDLQIEVFQTYYLNFCEHRRVYRCNTFASFEQPDKKIDNFNSGLWLQVVANYKYNTKSISGYYLHTVLLISGANDGLGFPYHDKAAFKDNLIKLQKRIIASANDKMIFAHFMVPHKPFGFTRECSYQIPVKGLLGRSHKTLKAQHHQEIMCVNRFLRGFFEGLQSAGVLDQITIVILSDHGSRLASANDARSRREKLVEFHSSLFAVRTPGIDSGYDTELHSVQYLFSKYMNTGHHERAESHRLARVDRNGEKIRMPSFAKVDLRRPENNRRNR